MEGMVVTPGYFKVAGLEPILGRAFLDSEGKQKSAPVIILGYDFWQRKFNGDPNVIGTTVRVSRFTPPTVAGVMPRGCVSFLRPAWQPNRITMSTRRWIFGCPPFPIPAGQTEPGWDVVGRLSPGATPDQAKSELSVLATQEAQAERDSEGVRSAARTAYSGNES